MAHRTDFPEQEAARAKILNCDISVCMPWCYFSARVLNLQQQKKGGCMDLMDIASKFAQFLLQNLCHKRTGVGRWLLKGSVYVLRYVPRRNPHGVFPRT
jgi:hypothetical protein